MRLCIVTGEYFHPQETQINFHIANLFGGDVAVLSARPREPDPFGVPHFAWATSLHGDRSLPTRLWHLAGNVRGVWEHQNARVPYGRTRREIQRFLKEAGVTAVLSEFGSTAVRITPVLTELGLPVFAYFRGADASSHLREPLRAMAYRRMMPNLRGVFSVSQFLLDQLSARGVRHQNSFVVPSGVDTSRFAPGQKRPGSFLMVGRLIEKKRPDITVEAFCKATKRHEAARLEIVGDGEMLPICEGIVERHGMADRVVFHGRRPHDFVRQRLAGSEVFLQHSVTAPDGNTEGLPTSIQEAMASGALVISTRHAGIPEAVVEGETGFLVDEGDSAAFAGMIARSLSLGDRLPKMTAKAREIACTRFDNRKLVKVVEKKIVELSG